MKNTYNAIDTKINNNVDNALAMLAAIANSIQWGASYMHTLTDDDKQAELNSVAWYEKNANQFFETARIWRHLRESRRRECRRKFTNRRYRKALDGVDIVALEKLVNSR